MGLRASRTATVENKEEYIRMLRSKKRNLFLEIREEQKIPALHGPVLPPIMRSQAESSSSEASEPLTANMKDWKTYLTTTLESYEPRSQWAVELKNQVNDFEEHQRDACKSCLFFQRLAAQVHGHRARRVREAEAIAPVCLYFDTFRSAANFTPKQEEAGKGILKFIVVQLEKNEHPIRVLIDHFHEHMRDTYLQCPNLMANSFSERPSISASDTSGRVAPELRDPASLSISLLTEIQKLISLMCHTLQLFYYDLIPNYLSWLLKDSFRMYITQSVFDSNITFIAFTTIEIRYQQYQEKLNALCDQLNTLTPRDIESKLQEMVRHRQSQAPRAPPAPEEHKEELLEGVYDILRQDELINPAIQILNQMIQVEGIIGKAVQLQSLAGKLEDILHQSIQREGEGIIHNENSWQITTRYIVIQASNKELYTNVILLRAFYSNNLRNHKADSMLKYLHQAIGQLLKSADSLQPPIDIVESSASETSTRRTSF